VFGSVPPGKPIRLPHGAACPMAAVRAAAFHFKVLQIGQIDDQAKGKEHPPPHQCGFKYVVYPVHNVGLIYGSG